ncbi:hypothetical protein Syun_007383 [Stephania yunnanensis]|uniref:Uncharacterized protein n=1 Tax=Stephania yunnanensis TaxID=152371 RepID=A0AAP0L045_9MAGN
MSKTRCNSQRAIKKKGLGLLFHSQGTHKERQMCGGGTQMTIKVAATADELPGDSPARRHEQPTVAERTAATSGLADVVTTSSSVRRHRFDEVSTADNSATSARKFAKKRREAWRLARIGCLMNQCSMFEVMRTKFQLDLEVENLH